MNLAASRWRVVIIGVSVLACGSDGPQQNASPGQTRDCFGTDSIVAIGARSIGTLRPDLPLDSIRRLCTNLQWTTTSADETLDTAIVMSRPGLRVVGVITTVEGDGAPYRPVHFDSSTRVELWKISGTAAELPGRIPITATWRDLRGAYGPLRASALNGVVYVSVCRHPFLQLFMPLPSPESLINGASTTTVDSVMATTRIDAVGVRPGAPATPPGGACSE